MKAEHRKELHTNLLADRMNRFVQGMKTGQQTNTAALWVLGILLVGVIVGWFWARSSDAGTTRLWMQLDRDMHGNGLDALPKLERMAHDHSGTVPGRMARFQQARILLDQDGLPQLSSAGRPLAITHVQEARDLYKELAEQCRDSDVLREEALLGTARAEEALIGIRPDKDSTQDLGDLRTALKYYHQYLALAEAVHHPAADDQGVGQKPTPTLAETVRQHVEELENSESGALDFYRELSRVAEAESKNQAVNHPPIPGGPVPGGLGPP
jgi:hypothetical protein